MSVAGTTDLLHKQARRLGYVASSAFKLLQLQEKYKLIKPGSSVLDLGCAPGGWLQVACTSLGSAKHGGIVVGIDLKKVKNRTLCDSRLRTLCGDVMSLRNKYIRTFSPKQKGFSVILSDMCPLESEIESKESEIDSKESEIESKESKIESKDAASSTELGMRALNLAAGRRAIAIDKDSSEETDACLSNDGGILLPGGNLVVKVLESEDMEDFDRICKPLFKKSSWLRPEATSPSSQEIYLICQGFTPTS